MFGVSIMSITEKSYKLKVRQVDGVMISRSKECQVEFFCLNKGIENKIMF